MTLRERILSAQDLPEETIAVPEWGCEVIVRGLSGKDRAHLVSEVMNGGGKADLTKLYGTLAAASFIDPETRTPIFEPGDADLVNGKNGAVLERLAQAAMRLSGLSADAVTEAKKN